MKITPENFRGDPFVGGVSMGRPVGEEVSCLRGAANTAYQIVAAFGLSVAGTKSGFAIAQFATNFLGRRIPFLGPALGIFFDELFVAGLMTYHRIQQSGENFLPAYIKEFTKGFTSRAFFAGGLRLFGLSTSHAPYLVRAVTIPLVATSGAVAGEMLTGEKIHHDLLHKKEWQALAYRSLTTAAMMQVPVLAASAVGRSHSKTPGAYQLAPTKTFEEDVKDLRNKFRGLRLEDDSPCNGKPSKEGYRKVNPADFSGDPKRDPWVRESRNRPIPIPYPGVNVSWADVKKGLSANKGYADALQSMQNYVASLWNHFNRKVAMDNSLATKARPSLKSLWQRDYHEEVARSVPVPERFLTDVVSIHMNLRRKFTADNMSIEEGVRRLESAVSQKESKTGRRIESCHPLAAIAARLFPKREYHSQFCATVEVVYALGRFRKAHGSLDPLSLPLTPKSARAKSPGLAYFDQIARTLGVGKRTLGRAAGIQWHNLEEAFLPQRLFPFVYFEKLTNLLELSDPTPFAWSVYGRYVKPFFRVRSSKGTVTLHTIGDVLPYEEAVRTPFGDYIRAHYCLKGTREGKIARNPDAPISWDTWREIITNRYVPTNPRILDGLINHFEIPNRSEVFLLTSLREIAKLIPTHRLDGTLWTPVQHRQFSLEACSRPRRSKLPGPRGTPVRTSAPVQRALPGTLGYALRFEMGRRGLTAAGIAKRHGLSPFSISAVLDMKRRPNSTQIKILSEETGISAKEISRLVRNWDYS